MTHKLPPGLIRACLTYAASCYSLAALAERHEARADEPPQVPAAHPGPQPRPTEDEREAVDMGPWAVAH